MFRLLLISVLISIFFAGCESTPSGAETYGTTLRKVSDFELVDFTLGRNLGFLSESRIRFDYIFSIGKHEVTQREFEQVMGYNPVPEGALRSPDFPVVMVSLYEAVLFCNAASKLADLDTAYEYVSAVYDESGSLTSLERLKTDYSANGFRLPTEAEWESAARGKEGSIYPWGNNALDAASHSWGLSNAGGTLHEVCSLTPTNGVCDLGGNALEWTDGWFGNIPPGTLDNFVGSSEPNTSFARIVKGGSFRTDTDAMRADRRLDVYATTSNTRTDYLGFRIAQGGMENPSYESGGHLGGFSQIQVVATKKQISEFFGSYLVRLVFVDGITDALVTVDFSNYEVAPRRHHSESPARHPSFSPNGKWLTFSDRMEGISGKASSWIASWTDLNHFEQVSGSSVAIPRWKVVNGDTLLIYVNDASANRDSVKWASEKTYSLGWKNGMFNGAENIFTDNGAFHDGISDDGRFLVTSYTDLRVLDNNTGKVSSYFHSPQNGKDAEGSAQACNASVRPGENPEIAFLDFGYGKESSIVGKSYRSHEYLFFMDPATGNVRDYLQVPAPYRSFDFSEWSNLEDFLITTVVDASDAHAAIYAIRRSDKAMLKLAEGTDLWHPALFVKDTTGMSAMSPDMFRYDLELPDGASHLPYAGKMMLYWNSYDEFEVMALGSSRTDHGINPVYFNQKEVFNFGIAGGAWVCSFHFWKDYIRYHSPKVKWIILEMSIDFLSYEDSWWYQVWGASKGYQYDKSQNFYANGLPEAFPKMVELAKTNTLAGGTTDQGYTARAAEGWGAPYYGDTPIEDPLEIWKVSLQEFEKFLQEANERGIRVIAWLPPQSPGYSDPSYGRTSYGRYGPSLEQAAVIMDSLQSIETRNKNLKLFDQHLLGKHDYTDEEAADSDHLAPPGAQKLTMRIDSVMRAWK